MQRMGIDAAKAAISQPAAQAQRSFDPAAVDLLVNNLCQVRVAGRAGTEPGQYIEPVQLQVVCYQLWARLTTSGNNPGISKDSGIIFSFLRAGKLQGRHACITTPYNYLKFS
jgi:hypothetical protein